MRFPYALAVQNLGAMAREVVEAYGNDIGAHPVGTGPYRLGEYRRSARIVLEANAAYRETTYAPAGPVPAALQPVAAAMKGKRLPFAGRIEVQIIEEGQARWLAFLNRELDFLEHPAARVHRAGAGRRPAEARPRGKGHRPRDAAATEHLLDLLQHEGSGRRRLHAGEDRAAPRDRASATTSTSRSASSPRAARFRRRAPFPRTSPASIRSSGARRSATSPAAARALLDRFGYKDRDGDGFREAPDGKPLVLERWSTPDSAARQGDELWKKNMDAIGLRMEFRKDKLPELRKMARLGKIPMRGDGWNADYPDAENFMQLLYGPNAGQENQAQFDLPEFNQLYDQARTLPDSPERTALFDRMTELMRRVRAVAADRARAGGQRAPRLGSPPRAASDPVAGLEVRRHRHRSAHKS